MMLGVVSASKRRLYKSLKSHSGTDENGPDSKNGKDYWEDVTQTENGSMTAVHRHLQRVVERNLYGLSPAYP
jgi:hypothetical protein